MSLNLASLGLTATNMQSFGFSAQTAISSFGAPAIQQFVAQNLGVAASTVQQFNTADLFNFALNAENIGALEQGSAANITQLLLQADADLRNATGVGLNNLQFSFSPDSTVTGSLDGVAGATNSININTLLADGLSQIGMVA